MIGNKIFNPFQHGNWTLEIGVKMIWNYESKLKWNLYEGSPCDGSQAPFMEIGARDQLLVL